MSIKTGTLSFMGLQIFSAIVFVEWELARAAVPAITSFVAIILVAMSITATGLGMVLFGATRNYGCLSNITLAASFAQGLLATLITAITMWESTAASHGILQIGATTGVTMAILCVVVVLMFNADEYYFLIIHLDSQY